MLRFETVIKSLYCPNKNRATELVKYLVAEYFFGGGHETVLFLVGVFINIAFYGRELKYQVSDDT